jgi:hypothetical protein
MRGDRVQAAGRAAGGQELQHKRGPNVQTHRVTLATALALALALSACAGALPSAGGPAATPVGTAAAAPGGGAQRDLSADEKKVIIAAVAPSLRDAAAAKYHWAKFPAMPSDTSPNYCATVDAKSPYAAYNGRQAYIVEVGLTGGYVTSATLGLIAGGKDAALVSKMCEKYGLDPNKAT